MRDIGYYSQKGCVHGSESRELFKFWEISDNTPFTVQDRGIVAIED